MKVHIEHTSSTDGFDRFEEGFHFIGAEDFIKEERRIVIKPNFTFPIYRKGVMTNPALLEELVRYLKNYTNHIVVCESDSGGYNRFSMNHVFEKIGIFELSRKYDFRVMNLSEQPSKNITVPLKYKTINLPLPAVLLDETDLFITMPVPKIHMNTTVSLSLKNQWGVIQDPALRLRLHPYFADVIYAINKALPKAISIVDGRFGLTRSGPMEGDVLDLNWLLMSDDLFFADFIVTYLMGMDYKKIGYLNQIFQKENIISLDQGQFNTNIEPFKSGQFYLKRKWTDYPGLLAFHSPFWAYVAYYSPLSDFLHKLLYLFRKPFYDYSDPESTS